MRSAVFVGGLALALLASPIVTNTAIALNLHSGTAVESDLALVATKAHHPHQASQYPYQASHQISHQTCGESMYWSTKEGHCVDARQKSHAAKPGEPPDWESQCMLGKAGC